MLKYDSLLEDRDETHHRIYSPATGVEVLYQALQRWQCPTSTEVPDELEVLTEDL